MQVEWPDGHISKYSAAWLEGRSFTEETKTDRKHWLPVPMELWSNQLQDNIPSFEFETVTFIYLYKNNKICFSTRRRDLWENKTNVLVIAVNYLQTEIITEMYSECLIWCGLNVSSGLPRLTKEPEL